MKNIKMVGLAAIGLLLVGAVAYALNTGNASADDAAEQPMVPPVEVVVLKAEELRLWKEFSGRLTAVEYVQVRPRVSGAITAILFEEGAIVTKGQPLFVIDERPFKAAHASAKAALAAAESEVRLTQKELVRARKLVKQKIVSQSRYDSASNLHKVALSKVNSAKAQLQEVALNVEYANIKAPVSGRVGRAEITLGNVIQAGANAPVLTSIVSNDTLYVEFDVDEQTYIKSARSGQSTKIPVEVSLSGDDEVYAGAIHSFDNQLDATSGTIRARALLQNKDGVLIPGMFANVRLGSFAPQAALMISDKAIGTDQSKKFVLIVSPENKVEYREVTLGESAGGRRVVLSGLSAGEKVMVNSLQRVRPGMEVKPVNVEEAALVDEAPKVLPEAQ